jgi:hypothetical protein
MTIFFGSFLLFIKPNVIRLFCTLETHNLK